VEFTGRIEQAGPAMAIGFDKGIGGVGALPHVDAEKLKVAFTEGLVD
jgi:hypothetical protein